MRDLYINKLYNENTLNLDRFTLLSFVYTNLLENCVFPLICFEIAFVVYEYVFWENVNIICV